MSERSPDAYGLAVRAVGFHDATALGLMVYAALHQAPSAPIMPSELGDDLLGLGHDIVHGALYGEEPTFVAVVGDKPIGLLRLLPREFVRGAHIGTLQVLVLPDQRRRGVGSLLVDVALRDAGVLSRFERIELTINVNDRGLRGLVAAFNARQPEPSRWVCERLEVAGMRVDSAFVDVETHVLDLPLPTR